MRSRWMSAIVTFVIIVLLCGPLFGQPAPGPSPAPTPHWYNRPKHGQQHRVNHHTQRHYTKHTVQKH